MSNENMVISMLVTYHQSLMIATKCVGDKYKMLVTVLDIIFGHQHSLSFNISVGHQHSKDVTNIEIQSPTCHLKISFNLVHYGTWRTFDVRVDWVRPLQIFETITIRLNRLLVKNLKKFMVFSIRVTCE